METLRRLAADYMLSHKDDFKPFLTDTKTGEAYTSGIVRSPYKAFNFQGSRLPKIAVVLRLYQVAPNNVVPNPARRVNFSAHRHALTRAYYNQSELKSLRTRKHYRGDIPVKTLFLECFTVCACRTLLSRTEN